MTNEEKWVQILSTIVKPMTMVVSGSLFSLFLFLFGDLISFWYFIIYFIISSIFLVVLQLRPVLSQLPF